MGEVTVLAKGGNFALVVGQKHFNELGLDPNVSYEIVKAKKGIWVLLVKESAVAKENPLERKILALLEKKHLKERVEGKFEKFLGKDELQRFKEMLQEGSIVAFKLSPKYKRAVYKTREEIEDNVKIGKRKEAEKQSRKKESESSKATEKPFEQYSFEKDGFIVCKNNNKAKMLSQQLRKEIEAGRIRGIKSFEGSFYIAQEAIYQKYKDRILSQIKAEKGIGSAKIAEKIGVSKMLAKIVCEFLKNEGEIIEKRKDQFQAI